MSDETIRYYDENAEAYDAATAHLDMSELYEPFLAHIPVGGKILDLGCGPGRDIVAFSELGYDVVGVDASSEMVALARSRTSCEVIQLTFDDLQWRDELDGIWACASLLHVKAAELPDIFRKIQEALVPGGVAYVSFKYGAGERKAGARVFTELSEEGLADVLDEVQGLFLLDTWLTFDIRPRRHSERWLNALLTKRRYRQATAGDATASAT